MVSGLASPKQEIRRTVSYSLLLIKIITEFISRLLNSKILLTRNKKLSYKVRLIRIREENSLAWRMNL